MTASRQVVDPPIDWCDKLIRRALGDLISCQEPCEDIWCCIEQQLWWPMFLRREIFAVLAEDTATKETLE